MGYIHKLSYFLTFAPEFHNIFYRRLGKIGLLLKIIFHGERTLYITAAPIGGGFFIRHGYSTNINTVSIGKNCTIHQNVTVGGTDKGIPTIGNNVFIGTGAIVLGPITIGDNVTIAAGAIVVEDVPANSLVIGQKAKIISNYDKKHH